MSDHLDYRDRQSLVATGMVQLAGIIKRVSNIDPAQAAALTASAVLVLAKFLKNDLEAMQKAAGPCGKPACDCHVGAQSVLEALRLLAPVSDGLITFIEVSKS